MKKIKQFFIKHPKLKITCRIIEVVMAIWGLLLTFLISFGLIIDKKTNYKPIIYQHEKPINNLYEYNDNKYYYMGDFTNTFVLDALGEYLWSQVGFGGTYTLNSNITIKYGTQNNELVIVDKIKMVNRYGITSGGQPSTVQGYGYWFQFLDSTNNSYYYTIEYKHKDTTSTTIDWNTFSSYYHGSSNVKNPISFVIIPNNCNISSVVYNAYLSYTSSGSSGGYTQEDLDNAYNEGYTAGQASANQNISNVVDIVSDYDFRTWFSNSIYTDTGIMEINSIPYTHNDFVAYEIGYSGGSTWTIGDKIYNAIVFTVISLDDDVRFYNHSTNEYTTGAEIYGSTYTNLYWLSFGYYAYFESEDYAQYVDMGFINVDNVNIIKDVAQYSLKVVNGYTVDGVNFDFYDYSWTSGAFRHLTNWSSLNAYVNTITYGSNFTLYQLLTLSDNTVYSGNDYVINVFGIIKQSFNAISGIFNIQILPHITLGVLMFTPLVFIIVMALIRILRK